MKVVYYITLHIINLFFLVIFGIVILGVFSNPAAGSTFPLHNPVLMSTLIFLLLFLIAHYIFQLVKKNWLTLLIGSILYFLIFVLTIFVVSPYLNLYFGYN